MVCAGENPLSSRLPLASLNAVEVQRFLQRQNGNFQLVVARLLGRDALKREPRHHHQPEEAALATRSGEPYQLIGEARYERNQNHP